VRELSIAEETTGAGVCQTWLRFEAMSEGKDKEDEENPVPHGRHPRKSRATRFLMWFLRKARQAREGDLRGRIMNLATVAQ
jgi:hypothetical protein